MKNTTITIDISEKEICNLANRSLSKKHHIELVDYHLEQLVYNHGFNIELLDTYRDYRKNHQYEKSAIKPLDADWNQIIQKFYDTYTKIWNNDLQTKETEKIKSLFLERVLRNAPNEAQELLYKLQDL